MLDDWPEIRALAYSDGVVTPTLTVLSSPESLAAFRELGAAPIARARAR